MKNIYTEAIYEEGISNIILQNRCGNRLTIKSMEDKVDMEFIYKPNAFRRKDIHARHFSNRDIYTELFKEFYLVDIKHEFIEKFDYDPFHTILNIKLPNGGTNKIRIVNIVDENMFAISAVSPLTLAFKPKSIYVENDGLLSETFIDRLENITTFIKYTSNWHNRFRVIEDGTYILQLCENDVIYVGGEESVSQANRVCNKFVDMSFEELIQYNEKKISVYTDKAQLTVNNPDFQRVLDLNRRLVFSAVDEGGVTHGAMQRIYYLNWYRDTLMSTSMFALAGNAYLLKRTYPFSLENPSINSITEYGMMREYLQLVGTRWTKSEDDGIFYVLYGLFNHFRATGDDTYLRMENLKHIIIAVDYAIKTLYDTERGLFGSDTLGETTLANSIFNGYDAVTGRIDDFVSDNKVREEGQAVYSYSLYQNVNMYNVLRMLEILINASPDADKNKANEYREFADSLQSSIDDSFATKDGGLSCGLLILDNGEEQWIDDYMKHDMWEYVWALSLAPFKPNLEKALVSAKFVHDTWEKEPTYGFCPWNTLSRFLKEYHVIDDKEYERMLTQEIEEALQYNELYQMQGALTEYSNNISQWRGLPFSTGSFMFSIYSLILQSLPLGIAVRASDFVDKVDNFYYKNYHINAVSTGEGEYVKHWFLNGLEVKGTTQIPEGLLTIGTNEIKIEKTLNPEYQVPTLLRSNLMLLTSIEEITSDSIADSKQKYEAQMNKKLASLKENNNSSQSDVFVQIFSELSSGTSIITLHFKAFSTPQLAFDSLERRDDIRVYVSNHDDYVIK